MKGLGVCMRPVGRFLLRCLVGKYGTILLTGALALLVGAAAYFSLVYDNTGSDGADQGTVYSVAAVDANLVRHPSAWIGRTVLVRGFLDGGPHRVGPGHEPYVPPRLIDPTHIETVDPLLVGWTGSDPTTAFLRGVPVLGKLVPPPQLPRWEDVATYRVQLRVMSASSCPSGPCYEGLVLDVASGDLGE